MRGTTEVTGDMKQRVAAELEVARARTTALLAPFSDEELTRQVSPLMSPLVWDLAHIGHFEELWISRRLGGAKPIFPEVDETYDAFAHEREERPSLELLDPIAARTYLAEVRARSLAVLDEIELDSDDPLLCGGFAFGLVVQHEQQHVETMLQTIQKGDPNVWPIAAAVAALGLGLILAAPRWLHRRRQKEAADLALETSA